MNVGQTVLKLQLTRLLHMKQQLVYHLVYKTDCALLVGHLSCASEHYHATVLE